MSKLSLEVRIPQSKEQLYILLDILLVMQNSLGTRLSSEQKALLVNTVKTLGMMDENDIPYIEERVVPLQTYVDALWAFFDVLDFQIVRIGNPQSGFKAFMSKGYKVVMQLGADPRYPRNSGFMVFQYQGPESRHSSLELNLHNWVLEIAENPKGHGAAYFNILAEALEAIRPK